MLNKQKYNYSTFFDIGLFLTLFIWLTIAIPTFGLIIHASIHGFYPVLAFILSMMIIFFINKRKIKPTLIISLSCLLILILIFLLSTYLYDFSFDGLTNHKSLAGQMKEGYNPVYMTFHEGVLLTNALPDIQYNVYYDSYPKGTEVFGASMYALTGSIETGKAYTLITSLAVILIVFTILKNLTNIKTWQAIIIGLALAFNPVSLPQMITYYNDAFLGNLIFITVFALIYLTLKPKGPFAARNWLLIFLAINLVINIKMSGAIYLFLYCFPFFLLWLVQAIRRHGWQRSRRKVFSWLGFYLTSLISAFVFLGSTSYAPNLVRHGNPFYTMIGDGKIEIMDPNMHISYLDMSHIERFMRSTFSALNDSYGTVGPEPYLKMPFTYTQDELLTAFVGVRLSGWGFLFSGILLISVVVLTVALIKMIKNRNHSQSLPIALVLFAVTFVPVFFIPGFFWARYFMQYFLVPAGALLFLFLWSNQKTAQKRHLKKRAIASSLALILTLLLIINCLPILRYYNYPMIKTTRQAHQTFYELEQIQDEKTLVISLIHSQRGIIFNIKDAGIYNYELTYDDGDYNKFFNGSLGYKILE